MKDPLGNYFKKSKGTQRLITDEGGICLAENVNDH